MCTHDVLGLVVAGLWISPTYQCVRIPLCLTLVFHAAQDERLKSQKPHASWSTAQAKDEHHHQRSNCHHFPARRLSPTDDSYGHPNPK